MWLDDVVNNDWYLMLIIIAGLMNILQEEGYKLVVVIGTLMVTYGFYRIINKNLTEAK